jgi:hypothetical protein
MQAQQIRAARPFGRPAVAPRVQRRSTVAVRAAFYDFTVQVSVRGFFRMGCAMGRAIGDFTVKVPSGGVRGPCWYGMRALGSSAQKIEWSSSPQGVAAPRCVPLGAAARQPQPAHVSPAAAHRRRRVGRTRPTHAACRTLAHIVHQPRTAAHPPAAQDIDGKSVKLDKVSEG